MWILMINWLFSTWSRLGHMTVLFINTVPEHNTRRSNPWWWKQRKSLKCWGFALILYIHQHCSEMADGGGDFLILQLKWMERISSVHQFRMD
jgi:hypothetical protein